ncbi:hypothetical protein ZYGR_0I01750 [Zygosaccharomyces rouxii]|uniref:ZYRO0C04114p n=2 Tax=Zygosaccharomyces rouxii TaxID=4956 RepID=C5DSZ2_ZYGRC|nr:uncharacterized protein ZYRO0C04114g [Zygosaccharomyces rouxii]KAH9201908.1 hypothetical protein LQ764DRAFT_233595 [Zygosaccharomyces rouxii]GAV47879.1 hypothetical protein ZYGR_0I01750 [Zygosaccharomyces rouxii]CAR26903.1 ZYRO0C04114p [Zygosaccharomyces rouxii]
MEFDRSRRPFGQSESPKVEVKAQNSLFLINYTDVPSLSDEWQISVFIDIPTIDFYKDELTNSKLSRFNRQFKLQHLKETIYKSLTNGNEEFWDQWLTHCSNGNRKFVMRVSSSGSLRYVETIRFLVESVYEKLQKHQEQLRIEFRLDASPTSHKWFTTFLDPKILQSGIVRFSHVGTQTNAMRPSPFKDYYNLLSKKFEESQSGAKESQSIDSILIITNSMGVKALLTILSDRPLTNFITRESIEMLHDIALKKAHSTEEDTPLKRESSSLLNFQNQLITSNKDKAVRVRSPSIGRKTSIATPLSMRHHRGGSVASLDQEDADYEDELNDSDDEDEDEDEDESDSDRKDDEDDEGISFNVPSKLSHTRSSDFLSAAWNPGMNGRVRSLSLMDPPLRKPFATRQGGGLPLSMGSTDDEASPSENMRITNIYVHDGDFQDPADPSTATKRYRKRASKLPSRQGSANGLIPPEFYSRISSPSSSASSSSTSLQNLNMAPGTFSKMAFAGGSSQGSGHTDSLFEKNLINKSFEETRKNNLLDSIIEKIQNRNQQLDKNGLALNFVSNKTIPSQILDEEDLLMSGAGGVNISRNFSLEHISDEDNRSNSTVVSPPSKEDDNDTESTYTATTPTVALDLSRIKLYDDDPVPPPPPPPENPETSSSSNDKARPKYKKAVTLDLYGDDDLENSGGWVLGGNSR